MYMRDGSEYEGPGDANTIGRMQGDVVVVGIALRWYLGETQGEIARSMGVKYSGPVCSAIRSFLLKYSPHNVNYYGGDQRKALIPAAVGRWLLSVDRLS
jgi:hypothetical protein